MGTSVYQINKGINKAIEFKGIKAQYIGYLGGGLVILLVLFAVLYIIGVNVFVCVVLIFSLGAALIVGISRFSHRYGQYGLMKKMARKRMPRVLKSYSLTGLKNKIRR